MEIQKEGKEQKGYKLVNQLNIEEKAQVIWQDLKVNQVNPDLNNPKKYYMTFPYPYLNGRLHLGHAFSFTKCDFTCRYKRLDGYNCLFPQAYHCTGMPISAAANRLKEEYQKYTNIEAEYPKKITDKAELAAYKKETGKDYQYKESQFNILKSMDITKEEIPQFQDPYFWTSYFPPFAQKDLTRFGAPVDFRRSFITTDKNPYYNNFVEWQFTILKEKNYISFGKRPSIFSIKDNQMIADHDRASGEGLGPQEYTLIKMQVLEFPGKLEALKDRKVFLVCGTLRPETMYGQTNCYVLPTGNYAAFEMKNNEVFICSERAAYNMAYQNITKTENKVEKIIDLVGQDILGLPLKAPLATFERVYSLPMMTIKMDKGTGVVTSVPSDSPDDWAALRDLQVKEPFRDKFHITKEMTDFAPVPIINIPELGDLAAVSACEEFKVKTQNDGIALQKAKDKCYLKGFYEGILKVGEFAGQKVQDAKPLVKSQLIASGEACVYYEPEGSIVARSGEECIVALMDQWYLNYADQKWKDEVMGHLNSGNFQGYNPQVLENVKYTVGWLKEWGCSRAFGLGTKMPFDKQFLIESLSDSTIYMAYYTIAHMLQGNVDGSQSGSLQIPAEKMTREVFDYIFLEKEYNAETMPVEQEKLDTMKKEFNYWYPLDLRCSGKDLIRNHLTMSLFNHAAIWSDKQEMWPRSYFCNGWVLVNGEKMSKSLGNFKTISDIIQQRGADCSRFALAEAGDSLEEANFVEKNAEQGLFKLYTLEEQIKALNLSELREKDNGDSDLIYFDNAFDSEIKDLYLKAKRGYDEMKFRNVLKYGFHEWRVRKEEYIENCGVAGPKRDLIFQYYELQAFILYPICPHFFEIVYNQYLFPLSQELGLERKDLLAQSTFPKITEDDVNKEALRSFQCFQYFIKYARVEAQKKAGTYVAKLKQGEKKPKIDGKKFSKVQIIYVEKYFDWQVEVLNILKSCDWDDNGKLITDWKKQLMTNQEIASNKALVGKCMKFGSAIILDYQNVGAELFETNIGFIERQVYETFIEKIKTECNVPEVEFIEVSETDKLKGKQYQEALNQVLPKKAKIVMVE